MSIEMECQREVAAAIYYHMFPDRPGSFCDDEWLYARYFECAGAAIQAYTKSHADVAFTVQPVDCGVELDKLLREISSKAVHIAAELVRGDGLPSHYAKDWKVKVPKAVLRQIETAHDSQRVRGVRLKSSVIDKLHEVINALQELRPTKRESGDDKSMKAALSFAINWIKGLPTFGNEMIEADKRDALSALEPFTSQREEQGRRG